MAPFIAVPQIYLARALRPLLADAARTEERIKLAEQLPNVAVTASTRLLVVGLICGFAMVLASGLLLLDDFLDGRFTGSALFSSSIFAVMGGLLTAYFTYLLRLKASLTRIMHQVACFCVRVDQARTGPSGGIGVRQLAVQHVWG
jgi:hypothetical protein